MGAPSNDGSAWGVVRGGPGRVPDVDLKARTPPWHVLSLAPEPQSPPISTGGSEYIGVSGSCLAPRLVPGVCPCVRYCCTAARADIVCSGSPTRTGMPVRGRVRFECLNRGGLIARTMCIFFVCTPAGHPPATHLKPFGVFCLKSRAPFGPAAPTKAVYIIVSYVLRLCPSRLGLRWLFPYRLGRLPHEKRAAPEIQKK